MNPAKLSRKRVWFFAFPLAFALVGLFHAPLLQLVAGVLIVDEVAPEHADVVAVAAGDEVLAAAIQTYQRGYTKSVILFQTATRRVNAYEVLLPPEQLYQSRLVQVGVNENSIIMIPSTDCNGEWREAHMIDEWLRKNTDKHVVILCSRFDSRRLRMTIDRVLPADLVGNVTVQGIPSQSYDETNWWRSRQGWKAVFYNYINFAYDWICGEDAEVVPKWDPDEFEDQLRKSI